MTTIGYDSIENILLSISDPNTWGAMTQVPWVSSPKINAWTSIYNEQWGWDWQWIAGWSTDVNWTSSDYDTVAWWSWSIYLPDGTALAVTSWNTGNMSGTTYIYYDREDNTVKSTTTASSSVWENKILLCVAAPTSSWKAAEFQAFWTDKQSTFITADNIAANTITGNEIAANTITASEIQSWAITTAKIDVWAVTAWKIDVSRLSDIDPDLWSITAWNITGTTITAGSTSSSAIKLYPYSSTQWRLDFYYNWNVVGYMYWDYKSAAGWGIVLLHGNNIVLEWTTYMLNRDRLDLSQGKLRLPVGTDVY